MSRLSLRARLVLGGLLVAAGGLLIADVATSAALRSSLFDRVDQTLQDDHRGELQYAQTACNGLGETSDFGSDGGPGHGPGGDPGVFVQVRQGESTILCTLSAQGQFGQQTTSQPALPAQVVVSGSSAQTGPGIERAVYFTVPATDGGGRYRVRASTGEGIGLTLILATSLSEVDSTLNHLRRIEVFVTLVVLAAIVVLGLWIVTLGLRPLSAIGRTADQITAGDLSRRVDRAEPR